MANWFDIERSLESLEELDKATLESFARVMPPSSQNPAFHRRFDQAQERIRRRLAQMESEELRLLLSPQDCGKRPTSDAWYKRPVGIIFIGVTGTTIALAIRAVLAHWFPNWFR